MRPTSEHIAKPPRRIVRRSIARTGLRAVGVLACLYVLGFGPLAVAIRRGFATAIEERVYLVTYAPLEWFMDHAPGGFAVGWYLELWWLMLGR